MHSKNLRCFSSHTETLDDLDSDQFLRFSRNKLLLAQETRKLSVYSGQKFVTFSITAACYSIEASQCVRISDFVYTVLNVLLKQMNNLILLIDSLIGILLP